MSADELLSKAITRRRSNGRAVTDKGSAPQPKASGFSVLCEPASDVNRPARVILTLPTGEEVELTRTIVAAIAHALWQTRGEDHLTNWFDAETAFNLMIGERLWSASGVNGTRAGRKAASAEKRPAVNDDGEILPALSSRPSRLRRL